MAVDDVRLEIERLQQENRTLRGAMKAQDERERKAGEACGVDYNQWGCDWPDAVAEQLILARREIKRLQHEKDDMALRNQILRDRPDLPPQRAMFHDNVVKLIEQRDLYEEGVNLLSQREGQLRRTGMIMEYEIEQICGKALEYPWYMDDQKNFPDATEKDGVCVGEHVAMSILQELVNRYKQLETENRILWLSLEQHENA